MGVDELHANAHSLPVHLKTSLYHIVSIQLSSEGSHVNTPSLVREHCLARDHRKVAVTGEINYEVRRQTISDTSPAFFSA
ncbi:hypothetical protein AJ88_46010 [Mesorhizobium amorphae CCBAU 01583]|nr:hypothetical protein AJ88_46010 [Mesorhizobium amorphae CCBAU 01583]